MKLQHIALNIQSESEIDDFYINVMNMEFVRKFTLQKLLTQTIFGLNGDVPVYVIRNGTLEFEIFIVPEKMQKGFSHVCFSVSDRESMIKKAESKKYKVIRIHREKNDLIFLSDNCGNLFEIR